MAEPTDNTLMQPVYGAFGNVLSLEEQEKDINPARVYNVFQQQAQKVADPQNLQFTYGTSNRAKNL